MAISESILRDMRRYADMDIDDLLSKLTDTEIEQLSMMVDPDDSMIPPSERSLNDPIYAISSICIIKAVL